MDNKRSYLGSITKYKELGSGASSNVYLCDYFDTCYAYKEYKTSLNYIKFIKPRLEKISELYNDSRYVVPFKFIYQHPKDELFKGYIMDCLYEYKDLEDLKCLSYNEKINILKQSKILLETLHNKYQYLHTDIAPWNCVYNEKLNQVKLIDFDSCIDLKNKDSKLDNRWSIFAEIYSRKHGVDKDLDIFMFNITTYSMLNNINYYKAITEIMNNNYGCIENNQAIDILSRYDDIEYNTLKKEYVIDYL